MIFEYYVKKELIKELNTSLKRNGYIQKVKNIKIEVDISTVSINISFNSNHKNFTKLLLYAPLLAKGLPIYSIIQPIEAKIIEELLNKIKKHPEIKEYYLHIDKLQLIDECKNCIHYYKCKLHKDKRPTSYILFDQCHNKQNKENN